MILLFIGDLIKGWFSNYISDIIFPGEIKNIKETVDKVDLEIHKVSESTNEIIQNLNIDPRIIKKYLDKLTSDLSIDKKEEIIQKWYDEFKINSKLKEILILIVKHKQKTLLELEEKVKNEKNLKYSNALKQLKIYFEKEDAKLIEQNYFQYINQERKKNLELLKDSIKATEQIFAFDETIALYKELIKQDPSYHNHFDFGDYLKNINHYSDAIKHFEKALNIYRKLANKKPETYLPNASEILNKLGNIYLNINQFSTAFEKFEEALEIDRLLNKNKQKTNFLCLARTLNNFANLHKNQGQFQQALEKYEEALNIKRDFAKEDLKLYLPNVPLTLNNLVNLHKEQEQFQQTIEKYEEALKINREFAKEDPRTYWPEIALNLNNLAQLYFEKNDFPQAIEKFELALKIRRVSVNENPKIYLPDLALTYD